MEKIDLKKKYRDLYLPRAGKATLVDVPEFQFVMIDGTIPPGEGPSESEEFQQAMGALYGASYTLKFMSKLRPDNPIDYTVMALEALWQTGSDEFDIVAREKPWQFTAMMMQPDHISEEMFREAVQQAAEKRPNPALDRLRFEPFREGLCVQIMHVGPYADEAPTIARMRAFAAENGYRLRGRHHEIYIGDPRRSKPEKLRTVLRHPVEPAV